MSIDLRILGCHGGETRDHRTSAFLVENRLAVDAGSITGMLTLEEQRRIEVVLVSHAHMDHVRDLATLADNRCQQGGPPLTIAATEGTLDVLKTDFFNGRLWPDFTQIETLYGPTVRFQGLMPETTLELSGLRITAVMVDHTVETSAFVIDNTTSAIAYSGDTGPTDRLWEILAKQSNLRGLLIETSFPNAKAELARISGHHTPATLNQDLYKLHSHSGMPVFIFHIKPMFQQQVELELQELNRSELTILKLGDNFRL